MNEIYEKYVGRVFDNRYRIEKVIGIGGMAIVFKATDMLMRRTVAVKILKDEISADEQSVKRFINESKAVAMLSHPNIVNIYDVSVRDNIKYIVMEFVEGITLKNYMKHREVLNLREIVSYTTQILKALDHAHKKGIVHRDIKPQNIMLLKNGIIKVMDFGIAKLPNAETVTMTDKAIGTVYYISPEQVGGRNVDSRSDLYSLGSMMYEMATGGMPFTAESPVSVALKHVNDTPTPPREINAMIPIGLEQIILHAMEKEPDERYQSAEAMLSHITKLRENPKIIFKNVKPQKKQKSGERKKHRRTSKSMFPIIMGVTLAFLITAGISGYYIFNRLFMNSSMDAYVNIDVENFVGATYTDELDEWFKKSEYYGTPTITYEYNDTVEKGRIISQSPAPDEVRKVLPGKQKCNVTFEISLGVRTIILDDYTVRDARIVESEIRRQGLRVKVESVDSSIYEIGYVIKTDPVAGTEVKEDDMITIYVSRGASTESTMVPNFVGLNEAQAMSKILENKLNVGSVQYVRSDSNAGSILEQSLEAWYEVTVYSKIDLVVSGGASYSGDGRTPPTAEDMKPSEDDTEEDWNDPWNDPDENETEDDWNDPWYNPYNPDEEETVDIWKDPYEDETEEESESIDYGGYGPGDFMDWDDFFGNN